MKKHLVVVGLTLIVIIVNLCGCTNTNSDVLSGLRYTNSKYGFGLNPPEGWTTQETPTPNGTMIFFIGPATPIGPTLGNYSANMLIMIDTSFSGYTLQNLSHKMIEPFLGNMNFSLLQNTEITVNGMDAFEIVYTMNLLEQKIVFVEKNTLVLVIVCSTVASTYNTYLTDFDTSINSLVIK